MQRPGHRAKLLLKGDAETLNVEIMNNKEHLTESGFNDILPK